MQLFVCFKNLGLFYASFFFSFQNKWCYFIHGHLYTENIALVEWCKNADNSGKNYILLIFYAQLKILEYIMIAFLMTVWKKTSNLLIFYASFNIFQYPMVQRVISLFIYFVIVLNTTWLFLVHKVTKCTDLPVFISPKHQN